jgi:hypothetical protein
MTPDDHREPDDYLWDPAATPSGEVQAVERKLEALRFDAARRPLSVPGPAGVRHRTLRSPLLALAASLAVIVAGASLLWFWRWSWPSGAPWSMTIARNASPATAVMSELEPDQPLRLDETATAQVRIARIGTMRVGPGSELTITETTSRRHRVLLDRGAVTVRVWAPPGRFAFNTPAGSVIDLGCVFDLSVDADGASRVRVDTGWVQMANGWGESLIPAGASSIMTAAARPGVPIYEDAAPEFVSSVRALERSQGAAPAGTIDSLVRAARKRDVFTLLTLAAASPMSRKGALLHRAAELAPPPGTVDIDAISAGDNEPLWRWVNTLDLPPVKSWWLNWRDALPPFN